ncbi:uncharacterized protein [Diadema setosum]|uniref:uncharacterized protein n=1 Tax=Diadema setosum TaxID=31175 RepID=UPI003B3A4DB3
MTEIQQLGQVSVGHGRLSTSDDLDLLFDEKDPILSDDVLFGLDVIKDAQDNELSFTNSFDLSDTDLLEGLITAEETEAKFQSVPSPESLSRSPPHSDSGISFDDHDQRSPASSHGYDAHTTDDMSHQGLVLETLDMSTILVGDDAMLITEAVVTTGGDSQDCYSDAAFSHTDSSQNLLPLTQKDVTITEEERSYPKLVLTEEEQRLLKEINVMLPTDVPLTKEEERHLKTVRRKIRNKASAQESRRKKKEYVDGLEHRVQTCTKQNRELEKRVKDLENKNESLLSQLRKLQSLVAKTTTKTAQAGTCVMVLLMSFALLVAPSFNPFSETPGSIGTSRGMSRNLLHVEDPVDEVVVDLGMSHSPKLVVQSAPMQDTSPALDIEEEMIVEEAPGKAQLYAKSTAGSVDDSMPLVNSSEVHSVQIEGEANRVKPNAEDESVAYTATVINKRKIHLVNDEM